MKNIDDKDCINIIPDVVKPFDEPFSDFSNTYFIISFCKKKSVK